MRRICVFCGSSTGTDPIHADAATRLGRHLAAKGVGMVYGGGGIGLMGLAADAALAGGGEVIGVIPRSLWALEVGHARLTENHVVGSMHERKAKMAELADGFVALPGGIGTLEELFEVWTWAQLGLHHKPVGLLNVAGYFDALLGFLDDMVAKGFLHADHRAMLAVADDPDALLRALHAYEPPTVERWFDTARS